MATIESWLTLLGAAMAGEFPWWGNLSYTHGAMRATGFAHGARRTLVIETLAYG